MSSATRVMAAFENHPDALSVVECRSTDIQGTRIAWVNHAFARLYGSANLNVADELLTSLWSVVNLS